jgi:hypothetical protein
MKINLPAREYILRVPAPLTLRVFSLKILGEFCAAWLGPCAILLIVSAWWTSTVSAEDVYNVTGLPAYPNLSRAKMDAVARTDTLGHWCTRFAAETFDRLDVVETWYRKALVNASETDLNNDERYKGYPKLSGIKLALGIDYVTVYTIANQSTTTIELFRCSAPV